MAAQAAAAVGVVKPRIINLHRERAAAHKAGLIALIQGLRGQVIGGQLLHNLPPSSVASLPVKTLESLWIKYDRAHVRVRFFLILVCAADARACALYIDLLPVWRNC